MALVAGLAILIALLLIGRQMTQGPSEPRPTPTPPAAQPLPGPHPEWDNQIRYACTRFGMTDPLVPVFVKAIIQQESGFNAGARGDYDPTKCPDAYRGDPRTAGYCAIGLMQVHRYWHPELAAAGDLRDPNWNIVAGCKVLAQSYGLWPDWRRMYAAYNGGAGAGAAWPNASAAVQRHVASVGAIFTMYAAEAGLMIV